MGFSMVARLLLYSTWVVALSICYSIALAVYRLYFSPLAKFPGSKLAIATGWYEFYYDCIKQGKYLFEIEKMHERYGPIIRINANEIHINDPEFYDQLYVTENVRKVDNYSPVAEGIDFEGSHFLTVSHELHKKRRRPLEPFFSPQGVRRLEPMLYELAQKLSRRLESAPARPGAQEVIRLDHACVAYSGDIIRRICSEHVDDFLDQDDFASRWYDMLHSAVRSMPLMTGFPWLIRIVKFLPLEVIKVVLPDAKSFVDLQDSARASVTMAKQEKEFATEKGVRMEARTSLFRSMLKNSDIDQPEFSTERLTKEAQVLFGAGTVSTARVLSFICFYILDRPEIQLKIRMELAEVMHDFPEVTPVVSELKKLTYLGAVIKEGLRLSYGVPHRLPHCAPETEIQYKQWTVPKNTPVGMSAYLMSSNPNVYQKPEKFIPERWLGEYNPLMDKYLVPFSRGSRRCLGQQLAYHEMYIALAVLFRPDGPVLKLFETDESDVASVHDFVLPLPRIDSKGIRIVVQ